MAGWRWCPAILYSIINRRCNTPHPLRLGQFTVAWTCSISYRQSVVHLVVPTAMKNMLQNLFPITKKYAFYEYIFTCPTQSILKTSYTGICVSWNTNKWTWSEWNCTPVSPPGTIPEGGWIVIDFLLSHASVFQKQSYKSSHHNQWFHQGIRTTTYLMSE